MLLTLNNINLELYKSSKPNRENTEYDMSDDYLKAFTYDTTTLETFLLEIKKKLTGEQNKVYLKIIESDNT